MEKIDWEQIPYFLAVTREGSLRAAAESLNATHGTVNRHLTAREASYGVRLFRRTSSGLKMTTSGHSFLPIAVEAETLFLTARRRVAGLDQKERNPNRFSLTCTKAYDIVALILVIFLRSIP